MRTKRVTKKLTAAYKAFEEGVKAILLKLGATETTTNYPFLIQTGAGPLRVGIGEGYIYSSFDDEKLAYVVTRKLANPDMESNKYSGKWNFYYSEETILNSLDAALVEFEFYLDWVVNYQPTEEMQRTAKSLHAMHKAQYSAMLERCANTPMFPPPKQVV